MEQGTPEILGDSPQFLRYEGMKTGFRGRVLELLKRGLRFMWGSQERIGGLRFLPCGIGLLLAFLVEKQLG